MKYRILLIPFLVLSFFGVNAQEFKLGVVTDFQQSVELDSVLQLMVTQIDQTAGSGKKIILQKADVYFNCQTLEEADENYQRIAARTDVVILLGGVSIKGAAQRKLFDKPTIGLGLIDPELQNISYKDGKSGIPNFTYIWSSAGLQSDLTQFKKIFPFKHLTLLVNRGSDITIDVNKHSQQIDSLQNSLGCKIYSLEIGQNIGTSLDKLNPETDAVYVADLGIRPIDDVRNLANQLITKKLPSFSSYKWHVYQGMLACLTEDDSFEQITKKMGIIVVDALEGARLEEMNVNIDFKQKLLINQQTADAIGLALPFEILFTSDFLHEKAGLPTYSLDKIIEKAFQHNLNIVISNQDIELAVTDVKAAKTSVLPNLDLALNGRQINVESANAAFDNPQRLLNGQLNLNQVIYSEKAFAGIRIARYYQKAQEYLTEAIIQEVLLNTYIDYFSVLSAKSVLSIKQENLKTLEKNLEIARLQVGIGAVSQSEIYRWVSEVAIARQDLIEASTSLEESKIALNNRLGFVLGKEYDIEDVSIDDQIYQQFKNGIFSEFVHNTKDISIVTDFLVQESVTNNPNKRVIFEQINALERINTQNKRMLFTPDVMLQANTNQVLARGGEGSQETGTNNFIDNTWSVGIGLRYPIFSQNQRRVELQTSRIQLDQLNNSKLQLDQELEMAVKKSILSTISTSTNIDFSRIAADNATSNFELVQVRYQEGDLDITQFIDAQRAALQSKLRYSVSVYEYMISHLQLEYTVGFFTLLSNESKKEDFKNRFMQFRNFNEYEK